MKNIKKNVLDSGLMRELMKELSEEEITDLQSYVEEFISPIESLSLVVKDMMSTEESKEKLAKDIIKLFTPEGNEELKKCLEKN